VGQISPRTSCHANDNADGRWKVYKRLLVAANPAQRNESSRAYLRNATKYSVEKDQVKFSSRPALCFGHARNMNSFTVFIRESDDSMTTPLPLERDKDGVGELES
jgi:hypothetical protein